MRRTSGKSIRERGQQCTHRREGTDRQGREGAGGDVRGWASEGTPGREGGEREWTRATVAAAPMLVQAVATGVARTGQCGGTGGGGEGGGPPAGGAVRGAGARGAEAPSPPAPGAGTGHHLLVGDGVGDDRVGAPGGAGGVGRGAQRAAQWQGAERGGAGRTGQRSGGGASRPAGRRAGEWGPAKWTHGQRGAGQGCVTSRGR